MKHILEEIKKERQRQDAKWGEQNHDHLKWNVILGEEIGEVQKELCELTFEQDEAKKKERENNLRAELVQSAAVIAAWIECMDRKNIKLDADDNWGIFNDQNLDELIENLKIKHNNILVFTHHQEIGRYFNWVNQALEIKRIAKHANAANYTIATIFGSKILFAHTNVLETLKNIELGYIVYFHEPSHQAIDFLASRIRQPKP